MKTVLVTGADHGLGYALVQRLLAQGHRVLAGQFLQEETALVGLQGQYKELILLPLDIGCEDSVKAARDLAGNIPIDCIINNAAILGPIDQTIEDTLDFSAMQHVFNVTALGALRVSHFFWDLLLKGEEKRIITISSEAGSISNCYRDSWFAYAGAKAALNMHSQIVHNSLKAHGGQVLIIYPGWIKTYMRGHVDEQADLTPEQAASCVLEVMDTYKTHRSERAVFVDYLGKPMPW